MAKPKGVKKETKSDFLRKVFTKNPVIDYRDANLTWQKAGNDGEISSALFYQVRSKMGIKIEWQWVREGEPEVEPTTQGSEAKSTTPKTDKANRPIFQLKITLKDIRPPIWRRVLVPDCSLTHLHEVIQVAFGWQNYHMFAFEVGGVSFTDPKGMSDLDMEDASRARLSEIAPKEKFKFIYTYDFGDNWEHEILVEEIRSPDVASKHPICVDGKRACPPEDVGGPWGYVEFVEAIKDPEHEQHEDMVEWAGEFEPEAFDRDAVNKELKRLR